METGESPEAAAVRETEEETGYRGLSASVIGRCHPNPAIQGNLAHIVLLQDCEPATETRLDPNEEIELALFTPDEALEMAKDGRINHALAMNAIFSLRALRPDLFTA